MTHAPYYESDQGVAEYLLFHYGSLEEVLPYDVAPVTAHGFPQRLVTEALEGVAWPREDSRALDLGCAVGRTSFELSRLGGEVVGIDYSHRFVETAQRLQQSGEIVYRRIDQGKRYTELKARLPDGAQPDKVHFEQGDACHLRDDLGDFDLLVLANLICRLQQPRQCLARIVDLTRPGGWLLIASPYTWLEEHTPTGSWIGGVEGSDGESREALTEILADHFTLVSRRDMPFLIREHARKYQWSVAEATLWQKHSGISPSSR